MKLLVFADVHGDFERLSRVIESIDRKVVKETDLVLCPGDFTDMFSVPKEFSQIEMADMVLQRMLSLNKPTLCVPGNHDPYEILKTFDNYNIDLHNKIKERNGHSFIGWGGALTPFDTVFEPSEEETHEALTQLGDRTGSNFILVVHNPPKETKMDTVNTGEHVGSQIIREFILEKKPLLAISAHIHEAVGTDRLGSTTLFNPGPVFSGNYGVVDIKGNSVKCRIERVE
jgi:Icc-related predicted phosphoesterase